MNSNEDKKLKAFLQTNAPIAPSAPPDELQVLLRRIENDIAIQNAPTKKERGPSPWRFGSSSTWIGGGAAVAASVLAFLMVVQPGQNSAMRGEARNEVVGVASEVAALSEEEFESLELDVEGPTSEVGDEYLGLIAEF